MNSATTTGACYWHNGGSVHTVWLASDDVINYIVSFAEGEMSYPWGIVRGEIVRGNVRIPFAMTLSFLQTLFHTLAIARV